GVEYGRLGPAILKIAAITLVVNGIYWIGGWLKLPGLMTAIIAFIVSFGLFMSQFDLHVWGTQMCLVVLDILMFIAHMILLGFLAMPSKDHRPQKPGPGMEQQGDFDPDDREPLEP